MASRVGRSKIGMTFIRIGFTASMVFCALLAAAAVAQKQDQKNDKTSPPVWTVPDINALPDDAAGRLVRHGRDLITMTDAYIGPHAADRDTRFAGNNLACGNCHLEAGTKKFGLPIFGLASDFPRYSARTGADISVEERMNGRPLPVQSPDMQALAAYVKFLSSGVVQGEQVSRSRRGHYARTRSRGGPQHGKLVYTRACLDCHNTNGSGIARSPQAMSLDYAVPPLWGGDSFNDGAGMARLITLENFLHSNMPHGADYRNPMLSNEAA